MQAAQMKADGKAQRVIVTGCLAQRYSEDLAGHSSAATCFSCSRLCSKMYLASSLVHALHQSVHDNPCGTVATCPQFSAGVQLLKSIIV